MEVAANIDLRHYQLRDQHNMTLNIGPTQWKEQNISLWENWQQYLRNRAVSDNAMAAIVAVYMVLIVAGSMGNGLVCLVVARKPKMRTARNVFIINLACSDLLLCLFTMPFTLIEVVLKVWSVGELMCKLVTTLQATSIYVSTMSITAIALDRYNVIVFPTREWSKRLGALVILAFIWIVAFLLASPLFVFRKFIHYELNLTTLPYVEYCYEDWPIEHGRALYSVAAMLFQYVLPITIVSVAHHRISKQLHTRLQSRQKLKGCSTNAAGLSNTANSMEGCRLKKTNLLLGSIALIFAISWMPLNILNLVTDFHYSFEDDQTFKIVFASCHVFGMSSACSNPLLYGWLNDNFRKEFKEVFAECSRCLGSIVPGRATVTQQTVTPVPLVTFQNNNSSIGSSSGVGIIASPIKISGGNNLDSMDPNGHYDSTGHLRWSMSAADSLQSFGEESSAITRITSTYIDPMDEHENSNGQIPTE